MTIASTSSAAGTTWTNVIDESVISHFSFDITAPPLLSDDNLSVTFTFGPEEIAFFSDLGFTAINAGIINAVSSPDTAISGASVDAGLFFNAIGNGDVDTINRLLWSAADTINGGASDDTIRGYAGSDTLFGNGGNDRLLGDSGNDKIYGGAGNDILIGGVGNDKLYGDAGNDKLTGSAGNDSLTGGAGSDVMVGGLGADTFVFKSSIDFGPANAQDLIRDFSHNDGDIINVHALDAVAGLTGNQDFTFIGTDPFTTDNPGTIRVTQIPNNPVLYQVALNTDADAQAEYLFIVVGLNGAPVAADFAL